MGRTKYLRFFLTFICLFSLQLPVYAEEQTEDNTDEINDSVQEPVEIENETAEEEIVDASEDSETSEELTEDENVETEELQFEEVSQEENTEETDNTPVFNSVRMLQATPSVYKVTVIDGNADVTEATKGTLVTLSPAEKSGYEFVGWTDGDGDLVSDKTNYTFEMPEWDVTFSASYVKKSDWRTDSNGKYYVLGNSYAKDQWLEIDGKYYRFDSNGYALVSTWYKEDNKWFYLDEEGIRVSDWKKVNGSWYYMNDEGIMQTGWKKIGGVWYYLQSSGAMKKGWLKLGQKWYFLSGSGAMVTGWKDINNKKYYFVPSGEMKTGWLKLDNTWYYLDPVNGDLKTGRQEIKNKIYYLDETTGAMYVGWLEQDNKKLYYDPSGALSIGWKKIDSKWYYFDKEGNMMTGWQKIKNIWYYMDQDGIMQTGWKKIGGVWYYLKESGEMAVGWITVDNKKYYMNDWGGMATGWKKINNVWHFFNGSGDMRTGWLKSGGKWYFLDSTGAMATGWRASGGKWYYLSGSGVMLTGLQKITNKWYYLDPVNGDMYIGKIQIGTISYEFNSKGELSNLSHNDIAYYSQTDPRWADVQVNEEYKPIRNTGCVPTAATTIVNYLKGTNYTPKDLANEFYNMEEYNYYDHGTNSTVWRKFASKYGLTFQNNMTYNSIVSALKDGKVCTAAMGDGYFASTYYTHEISFFGIDSVGRTYVYDPMDKTNNGWYSIREICNQLSDTFGDTLDDGPMFAFSNPSGAPKGSSDSANPSITPIGKAKTLVSGINIRKEPSTDAGTNGVAVEGKVYDVYEIKTAGGFTWYCIGTNQWIADKDGAWIKYTKN